MTSVHREAHELTNGGIFDGFEGYKTATRSDYVKVLAHGLVVLDANVLMDLYRFGKQGREDLLAALRAIGDRLWVPNHAVVEFWRNREGILKDPGGTVQLVKTLTNSKDTIVKALNTWGKHRSHPPETVAQLTGLLTQSFESIEAEVTELSKEATALWARDISQDEVLKALNEILEGKVGPPLSSDAYKDALIEAKRRAGEEIPPGYLDAKKPEPDSAGDYLVWEQLLQETSRRKMDVLLITRDAKDDWVRREGGEIRGPRIELINEALTRTGHGFFLRTPAQLLDLANDALDVAIHSESVENANRISDELTERELGKYSSMHFESFRANVQIAEVLLKHLEAWDPTAGGALKLASIADGRIDASLLSRMQLLPSLENFELIVSKIHDVIKDFNEVGIFAEHVGPLLLPVFDEQDAELSGYRIHPEFREPFRRVTLGEYKDDWPMSRSKIEREILARHSRPTSNILTTHPGTRITFGGDLLGESDTSLLSPKI